MKKNSIKNIRINEEMKKSLSIIISREIGDSRVSPMTSVTYTEVAPDLKTCKVYVSVLGDDKEKKDTLEGLKSAQGFIRSRVAKDLNLRNTPEFTFKIDSSMEYGNYMEKLIKETIDKQENK